MNMIFYLLLIVAEVAAEDDVRRKVIDTDLIKVQLPDNVSYTLIVVLVSYLLKMIFDVVYRLRKMECRWGGCCFCRSKFKDGEDEYDEELVEKPQCPACSPQINVNLGESYHESQSNLRRARLKSIITDHPT